MLLSKCLIILKNISSKVLTTNCFNSVQIFTGIIISPKYYKNCKFGNYYVRFNKEIANLIRQGTINLRLVMYTMYIMYTYF